MFTGLIYFSKWPEKNFQDVSVSVTDVMPVVLDPIDALLFQNKLYAKQKIITLSLTRHDFLSFISYHKLP
jgi:hypothetical protein